MRNYLAELTPRCCGYLVTDGGILDWKISKRGYCNESIAPQCGERNINFLSLHL